MEHVRRDVGPELTKYVGEGVAPQCISVLLGELFAGVARARVVGGGDTLSDGAACNLGNVERIVSVILARDEYASGGVGTALPAAALSQGVVTPLAVRCDPVFFRITLVHQRSGRIDPIRDEVGPEDHAL